MPGFWRKCRIAFRCVRFGVWVLVLAALGALLWCNRIGLPGFLKTRIVTMLHERGVELEFSRLRLSLVRGLVADNVRVGEARSSDRATLTARSVQLELNFPALCHGRWQLDGLVLSDGDFTLPVSPTNALTLTNLQAALRLGADDTWSLDHFRANLAGAQFAISGDLAHAPAIRDWKMFSGGGTNRSETIAVLKDFSDVLRQIQFQGEPQLRLNVSGDARNLHSLAARIEASATGVVTPTFTARDFMASARLTAPANAPTNTDAGIGFWTNLQPFRLVWSLQLGELRLDKLQVNDFTCAGRWAAPELAITNFSAKLGGGQFQVGALLDVFTRRVTFTNTSNFDPHALAAALPAPAQEQLARVTWQRPPQLQVTGAWQLPPWTNAAKDWPGELLNDPTGQLHGQLAVTNLAVTGVAVDRVQAQFSYTNLVWALSDLTLVQGRTQLTLNGEESEATKNFHLLISGRLDAASLRPFLPATNAFMDLAVLTASEPLTLALDVSGNRHTLESLTATGRVAQGRTQLALSGQVSPAPNVIQGHVAGQLDLVSLRPFLKAPNLLNGFTSLTASEPLTLALDASGDWPKLEGLTATGRVAHGQTELALSARGSKSSKDFSGQISGQLDAAAVKVFLPDAKAVRGFGLLTFHQPLAFTLAVTGNLATLETLSATGRLALADFAIRSETVDQVTADMTYSNLTAEFFQARLTRAGGAQHFAADKVTLDLAGQRLFIQGGAGSIEPMVVGRAIGPKTAAAMAPYEFLELPTALVNGCIPLKKKDGELVQDDADLRSDIVGTAHFRWRKFETPAISGRVHWWNHNLILTNVVSECYGGEAHGWATFDLRPEIVGTDFSFDVTGTNVNFHRMAQALWAPTNHLEGFLAGTVSVTSANSSDWHSWNGFGSVKMQDGLLWDFPIFGILSPVLNTFSSGLGNSRATEATARCSITNGVIFSDSLLIRSTLMRLSYTGTVDMQRHVNARVTAHLFRDIWVLGPLVSTVLWPVSKIFECEVTGTLDDPKATPILLPAKLLLVPLHPISTLKEIFLPPPNETSTAAPATK